MIPSIPGQNRTEAFTRSKSIDVQLRESGWKVDTQSLTFEKGARPEPHKNMAIAEWPTENGRGYADYVLFAGMTPVAVIEAKKSATNIPGSIAQAKRYSRGYLFLPEETSPGGPWGEFKVPFLFATNGRSYLPQIAESSGIWFLDTRRATNHPRPLMGWYRPEGLIELLGQDIEAAEQSLRGTSSDYLPLRDYQRVAVESIELSLANGTRTCLVAMATGTGKTRTAVCLIYRLLKAGRFRRVLFLVDRTVLGVQAGGTFKDVRVENLQSLADIYDVKDLGDIQPDLDTRVHIATIQGMLKRVFGQPEESKLFPIDAYDCIIVDECHRGYYLDRELSETELTYHDELEFLSQYRRVLNHFDAVKIGLTATPALHTTEIFGVPVYEYSYRQAVIDGYLVDHEPPISIVTELAEEGIAWEQGETVKVYDVEQAQIQLFNTPDEIDLEVEDFNLRVVTENFNRVVCRELARRIDPSLPGKTLIFCVTDQHADLVVRLMKESLDARYGSIEDDAVLKITGKTDRPLQQIRRYRNERLPSIAVTVDLLTTGIDVPEIVNLVFIRRVKSRILYEQMQGRATRLCPDLYGPGEDKEFFRIYDAVNLYSAIEPFNSMKPVVKDPNITLEQLVRALQSVQDEAICKDLAEQIEVKLRRRRKALEQRFSEFFMALTGMAPGELCDKLHAMAPIAVADYFASRPKLLEMLDRANFGPGRKLYISEHEDALRRVEHGYGETHSPEDYLERFGQFIRQKGNEIPALLVVTQRPRDLTRAQLRELRFKLDEAGFNERTLETAWKEKTNQEIAASIIGFIRTQALGAGLLPYEERLDRAVKTILTRSEWTDPQRRWLERIAKQMKIEIVMDSEFLNHGQFKAEAGGFDRLNKVFDGKLEEILGNLQEELWRESA